MRRSFITGLTVIVIAPRDDARRSADRSGAGAVAAGYGKIAAATSAPLPLVIPHSQGKETSTLELAVDATDAGEAGRRLAQTSRRQFRRGSQELGAADARAAPAAGLRTSHVTVTEPSGTYVTGLQKGDFQTLHGRAAAPDRIFRQDLNTPVSVGILVDTSGSMTPKIPQAARRDRTIPARPE